MFFWFLSYFLPFFLPSSILGHLKTVRTPLLIRIVHEVHLYKHKTEIKQRDHWLRTCVCFFFLQSKIQVTVASTEPLFKAVCMCVCNKTEAYREEMQVPSSQKENSRVPWHLSSLLSSPPHKISSLLFFHISLPFFPSLFPSLPSLSEKHTFLLFLPAYRIS